MMERPRMRKAQRVRTRVQVQFETETDLFLTDYTVNLSSEGLFLSTQKLFPVNSNLTLEFLLPLTQSKIRCQGQVAWVNPEMTAEYGVPAGMGIRFLNLPEEGVRAIREFVQEGVAPSW